MSWSLSRFRTGDLVEVRSQEEILATLDQKGCVDGMPFMPEMLQYCGRRFCVSAVAHKTCDTVRNSGARRLQSTVHLAGLRCDGSAHGGCQAECNLFWKDAWLKPAGPYGNASATPVANGRHATSAPWTEARLLANTHQPGRADHEEPLYACQATRLLDATEPLRWWDVRQYVYDVVTGNRSGTRVLRVLWLGWLRRLLRQMPWGYRLVKSFHDGMNRLLLGLGSPYVNPKIQRGAPTPTGHLDLRPGELVRIKSKPEIEETLDQEGKNRGLLFDAEMTPYCDRVFKVRKRVSMIIDEPTGKMRHMKQPCIMLDSVVCNGDYSRCRLMCPRAIPSYWREIWLERVPDQEK